MSRTIVAIVVALAMGWFAVGCDQEAAPPPPVEQQSGPADTARELEEQEGKKGEAPAPKEAGEKGSDEKGSDAK